MADITAPPLLIRPKATDGTLQFYWYPPANIGTGASFVSTYTITLTDASGGFPVPSTLTVNTPFATYAGYTTAIMSSMTNGIKYTYGITAKNDLGFSSPPTLFRRVAPGFKPQAVASVGAFPRSATSALVTWVSSGVVATPPIEWFVAKAISSNGADPILARSQYPFMSNVLISSLNAASSYRYYVYAVNDPGYSIPAFTPYLTIPNVNTNNLIVYLSAESYPGYGTWIDRSGNNYNAVIENGTATLNAAGNGLVLNGSTNWRFPPTGPTGIGSYSNFTLQTWYKQTGSPVGPDSGAGACVVTETYTGNTVNMAITTSYSTPLETRGGTFYNGAWTFGPNFNIANNEWHNLAITHNGSQLISYKDGSPIGTVSGSDAGSLDNNFYRIGRRWDIGTLADYVVGEIGQVLIYGRAMSGTEVMTNVNSYPLYLQTHWGSPGANLSVTDNNLGLAQTFGQQASCLATTLITTGQKVMYSIKQTQDCGANSRTGYGFGTASMHVDGYPPYNWGGYPGNDAQSIGVLGDGTFYFNGTLVSSGLSNFGAVGDIIDVAIHDGVGWWIRVNGGNWNNDPGANPATDAGGLSVQGLTGLYPAGCPGGWSANGACILITRPASLVPDNYLLI
jgi:hypothetical protein